MSMTALDQIFASDAAHRQDMERGSSELATACNRLRRGSPVNTSVELIWRNGNTPTVQQDPESRNEIKRQEAAQRVVDKQQRAEAQRAMRDPCPHCGVRQDIGCKHVRHLYTVDQILTNTRHVDAAWEREVREARQGGEG